MALLGLFKRQKQKTSSKASDSSYAQDDVEPDSPDADYVLPPPAASTPSARNGADHAMSVDSLASTVSSSRKLKFPFRRRLSKAGPASPLARTTVNSPYDLSTVKSTAITSGDSLLKPPRPIFPSFPDGSSSTLASSVRSLPADVHRPQSLAVASDQDAKGSSKSSGMFSWATRERKKSRPSDPPPQLAPFEPLPPLPTDSFNLKSFRHVQSELPPTSSKLSLSHSPPNTLNVSSQEARPRGSSMASDSSQRISVAAFREAQARRSSTNLSGLSARSPSPLLSSSTERLATDLPPPRPPRAVRPTASPARDSKSSFSAVETSAIETSSESSPEEEESDSDEGSPSRSRSRPLGRQRTVTNRTSRAQSDLGHGHSQQRLFSHHEQTTSSRSEHGHDSSGRGSTSRGPPGPPPSAFQNASVGTRSFSVYRRQRASYSTSELTPNAAAKRASVLAEVNKRDSESTMKEGRPLTVRKATSDSDSECSSDEDVPLSTMKRPGSSMSHTSLSTIHARPKPLVDLNMKYNPFSGKPVAEDLTELDKKTVQRALVSPTNINDRLTKLLDNTSLAPASKSEENLIAPRSKLSRSLPMEKTTSPKSITPILTNDLIDHSGGRRTPILTTSPVEMDDDKSIGADNESLRPIPVRERSEHENSGFKVVSRPQKSPTKSPPIFVEVSPKAHEEVDSSPGSEQPKVVSYHRERIPSFSVLSRPQSVVETSPTQQTARQAAGHSRMTSVPIQPVVQRPFVTAGTKRTDSPASSTGGSSNGRAPLTPMDGSDYFSPDVRSSGDSPTGSSIGIPPSAMKRGRGHQKRQSVTFQEPLHDAKDDRDRVRPSNATTKGTDRPTHDPESKRRERRRSEAKAAIELGNVINGKGPVTEDDDDADLPAPRANVGPRLTVANVNALNSGIDTSSARNTWNPWQQQQAQRQQMAVFGTQQPFMYGQPAPVGADPNYLMAHQHAMALAKQAYQFAVAQQAMAQAGEEWERGSSISGFTPPVAPSTPGVGVGMGIGMGVAMGLNGMGPMTGMTGMGMNMGGMGGMGMLGVPAWGAGMPVYPGAPRSMYAGSAIGTPGGSETGQGWEAASVYGDNFGPSPRTSKDVPSSNRHRARPSTDNINFPSSSKTSLSSAVPRSSSSGNIAGSKPPLTRSGARQRTNTAPSNSQLPPQHHHYSKNPPSSWRVASPT